MSPKNQDKLDIVTFGCRLNSYESEVIRKTATEDETSKFLDVTEIRTVIERVVTEGGAVSVEDKTVTINLPDGVALDQALVHALVDAVGH